MSATEKPHVLLINVDHWPGVLLGRAGHPVIQTPTLDQLALNGVLFTNAYSECPVCIPARRTLMTGTLPRTHGDRVYHPGFPMPTRTTLAQAFRNAGYQAQAVGKLHVYPPRDRIGFDDVLLTEEGRTEAGTTDDYEIFLGERGYPGQYFAHGLGNNAYLTRFRTSCRRCWNWRACKFHPAWRDSLCLERPGARTCTANAGKAARPRACSATTASS